jgi:hypothetical protein
MKLGMGDIAKTAQKASAVAQVLTPSVAGPAPMPQDFIEKINMFMRNLNECLMHAKELAENFKSVAAQTAILKQQGGLMENPPQGITQAAPGQQDMAVEKQFNTILSGIDLAIATIGDVPLSQAKVWIQTNQGAVKGLIKNGMGKA